MVRRNRPHGWLSPTTRPDSTDHEGGFDVNRDVTLPSTGESTPRLDIDADIGIGLIEVTDAAS